MFLTLPRVFTGLHKFPEDNDSERKRRRLWIAFVRTKRAKWSPTDASRICSQHFKADDFESPFIAGTAFVSRAVLKKDAVPSIHSQKAEPSNVDNDISSADLRSTRKHRNVSKIEQICTYYISVFTSHCFYCHAFVSQI